MSANNGRTIGRPKKHDQSVPLHEKILHVATLQFMEHGFKDISMNQIAALSNVTKATIYYYFDSKAALFTETIVQLMGRIRFYTQQVLDDETVPFKERLIKLLEIHMNATANIDIQKFVHDAEHSLSKEQLLLVQQSETAMQQVIQNAFEKQMTLGTIRQKDSYFVLQTFLALMDVGRHKNYDNQPLFDDVKNGAKTIIEFFWAGLQCE